MNLTSTEAAQLRALVWEAWEHRETRELTQHVERIVEWGTLRWLATIDLRAMRLTALEAIQAELRSRMSIDALVELLERTRPAWPPK